MAKKKKTVVDLLKKLKDLGMLRAESDKDLQAYYVGRDRYLEKALNVSDQTIFYIGPKGIGKSAILQMVRLERKNKEEIIINISPDDLAFSALANLNIDSPILKEGQNQWLFTSLWDYVLLMELWTQENNKDQNMLVKFKSLFRSKDEKRIERLFNKTIDDSGYALSFTDRIIQLIDEISVTVENPELSLSGKAKINHDVTGQIRFLNEINHAAKELPKILKNKYYILIDDLDRHWHNEPTQNGLIAALFTSLIHLSCPSVKFIVSIRKDIYKCLPLVDKDKSRDRICTVEWDMSMLQEMIEKRILQKTRFEKQDIWGNLFPSNCFEKLASHSTDRPRELIRLTNLCIECAKKNNHKRVSEDDLENAIRGYSAERLEDIASELDHTYPKLEVVLDKFRGKKKEFSLGCIDEIATELAVEGVGREKVIPWKWAGTYMDRALELAVLLLEIGFLQIKLNRTAIPEEYLPDKIGVVKEDMWFAVHPMYAPGLSLLGT